MNKLKRELKSIMDPEQDKYGVLTLDRDIDAFDIAADALIRSLEEAGACTYMSVELFGERRYLHVKHMTDDRLRELYENFTKAVDAVNEEVRNGQFT